MLFILRFQVNDKKNKSTDIDECREKEADFHVQKDEKEEKEEESKDSNIMETVLAANLNKCEFFSGQDINCFLEEPKAMSFTIQELYMGSDEFPVPETQILETQLSSNQDFQGDFSETEADDLEEVNDIVDGFGIGEILEKRQEDELSDMGDDQVVEVSSVEEVFQDQQEQGNCPEAEFSSETAKSGEKTFDFSNWVESFLENYALTSDEEPISNILSDGSSRKDQNIDSIIYDFSRESDREFVNEELNPETASPPQAIDEKNEENSSELVSQKEEGIVFSAEHNNDSEDEYIELEVHKQSPPTSLAPKSCTEEKHHEEAEEEKNSENDLEFVWEHEDVIEQLKWELKLARTGGLPTILEEESDSESPKEENMNLKPLKIDLKFGYKDQMEEIQKVYRIYAEKMRKLDILNNQTMHAVGKLIKFHSFFL